MKKIITMVLRQKYRLKTKLPYKFTSIQNSIGSDEFTSVLTYSYVFDEDGYPIQVVANQETSDGFSRTTRYELTYTN